MKRGAIAVLEAIKRFNEQGLLPCVTDIRYKAKVSSTAISRHIRELEKRGYIRVIKVGSRKFLCLSTYDPDKLKFTRRVWTREHDEFLIRNWGKMSGSKIAKILGWSETKVYERARKLGLPRIARHGLPKYLMPILMEAWKRKSKR